MRVDEIESKYCSKELKFTVSFQEVNTKIQESILEIAKTFKMPGFREGKVPFSIVKQKVEKDEIEKQVQIYISECIKKTVKERKLILSSKPDVEVLSFNQEEGLSFKVIIESMPEVPEIKWENVEIEKISIKISDKEIKQAKNIILKPYRQFNKVESNNKEYRVKKEDKVSIDFHGQINGNEFDGNKGKNMEVIVGEGNFLAEFENNLVGCLLGEEKVFNVLFPDDYPKKEIAGKTSVFSVKVISAEELGTITDIPSDILKKLGIESEERLEETIKKRLKVDFEGATRMQMKKQLFDIIDQRYNFELPERMVSSDLNTLWEEIKNKKEIQEKLKEKSHKEVKSEYKNFSHRRVRLGLIIADIIRKESIVANEEELKKIVESQAKQNPQIKDKILDFYQDSQNLANLRSSILEEKAFDFMLSKVSITSTEMSNDEFLKKIA